MSEATIKELTPKQCELVVDFLEKDGGEHRLKKIIWKIHKRKLPEQEFQDWLSLGELLVCEAAKDYDPNKGAKFSTFAQIVVQRRMKSRIRDNNTNKRKANEGCDSIDRPVMRDGAKTTLGDTIIDESATVDNEDEDLSRVAMFLKGLSQKQLRVLVMLLIGGTKSSVMKAMNMTSEKYDFLMKEKIASNENKKLFCIRR